MVNVAQSLKAFFKNQIDEAESKSFGNLAPSDDITPGSGGSIIVKGMDNSDIESLNASLKSGGFEKGLDLGRIGRIFESDFSDFNLDTVLTNIKNNNKDLFNHLRRDTKSMEEMLGAAGFEDITYKFLSRMPGQVLPPEDTLVGLAALI